MRAGCSLSFPCVDTEHAGGQSGLYPVHDMEMWQQYIVAFYWTITTLTTVGWGDITPKTTPEVVFTILVLIEGGAAFSYMVGNMATLINKINPRQLRYKESMAVWEDFMHRENLPTYLRQKIRAYKNYRYTKPLASLPEFAKEELSRTMLREIVSAVYSEHLKSFKMFKGLPEQSLMELALVLKPIQVELASCSSRLKAHVFAFVRSLQVKCCTEKGSWETACISYTQERWNLICC